MIHRQRELHVKIEIMLAQAKDLPQAGKET